MLFTIIDFEKLNQDFLENNRLPELFFSFDEIASIESIPQEISECAKFVEFVAFEVEPVEGLKYPALTKSELITLGEKYEPAPPLYHKLRLKHQPEKTYRILDSDYRRMMFHFIQPASTPLEPDIDYDELIQYFRDYFVLKELMYNLKYRSAFDYINKFAERTRECNACLPRTLDKKQAIQMITGLSYKEFVKLVLEDEAYEYSKEYKFLKKLGLNINYKKI